MTGFEERIFKEVIKSYEVIRVGDDIFRREAISTQVHTGKDHVETQGEAICKPRRGVQKKPILPILWSPASTSRIMRR